MTTKVEMYKTSDGQVFEDKAQADAVQRQVDFENWYENVPHLIENHDRGDYPVDAGKMFAWLIANWAGLSVVMGRTISSDGVVKEFLSAMGGCHEEHLFSSEEAATILREVLDR